MRLARSFRGTLTGIPALRLLKGVAANRSNNVATVATTPANICQQFLLACAADVVRNEHGISWHQKKDSDSQHFHILSHYFTLHQPYSDVGRTCNNPFLLPLTEWRDVVHRQAEQPEAWKQEIILSHVNVIIQRSYLNQLLLIFTTCFDVLIVMVCPPISPNISRVRPWPKSPTICGHGCP